MSEHHDERLGELLAQHVQTPPAIPEFTSRLWERIEKSGKVRRGRAAPLWRRRPLLAAVVVAGIATVVLAVSLLGRTDTSVQQPVAQPILQLGGPADASAAEVVAKVRTAMATVRALRARWQWISASVDIPYDELPKGLSVDETLDRATVGALIPYYPSDVTLTDDGRSRWVTDVSRSLSASEEGGKVTLHWSEGEVAHGVPPEDIEIQNETTGEMSRYQPEMRYRDGSRTEAAEQDTGYGAGPPDQNLTALLPFGPSPSAFSALENGQVRESTYEGRPAVTIIAAVKPGPIEVTYDAEGQVREAGMYLTIDKIEFTVDAASDLPVRLASYLRGKLVEVWTLSDLHVNAEVPASDFTFKFRAGAPVERNDFGFRKTSFGGAEAKVGYVPLVPTHLPAHFRLQQVRWASRTSTYAQLPNASGSVGTHEVTSRRVTSIGYRAGFLHLTVTMRPAKGLDPDWLADPFQEDPSAAGATVEPERVTLTSGALAGDEVRIAMPPLGIPHLWVVHDGMLITVAGDATRAELLRVAGSLEPANTAK